MFRKMGFFALVLTALALAVGCPNLGLPPGPPNGNDNANSNSANPNGNDNAAANQNANTAAPPLSVTGTYEARMPATYDVSIDDVAQPGKADEFVFVGVTLEGGELRDFSPPGPMRWPFNFADRINIVSVSGVGSSDTFGITSNRYRMYGTATLSAYENANGAIVTRWNSVFEGSMHSSTHEGYRTDTITGTAEHVLRLTMVDANLHAELQAVFDFTETAEIYERPDLPPTTTHHVEQLTASGTLELQPPDDGAGG